MSGLAVAFWHAQGELELLILLNAVWGAAHKSVSLVRGPVREGTTAYLWVGDSPAEVSHAQGVFR